MSPPVGLLVGLLMMITSVTALLTPLGCVQIHRTRGTARQRIPIAATLLARGSQPPERRIVRDGNGIPIRTRSGGRGKGRGGARGSRGRGRGGRSSPTPKPCTGDLVSVVEKANYGTAIRTNGTVARVLTRSAEHARGFKVMLEGGVVGRCTTLIERRASASGDDKPPTRTTSSASSSDDYLASIDLLPPPPGQRLRDSRK